MAWSRDRNVKKNVQRNLSHYYKSLVLERLVGLKNVQKPPPTKPVLFRADAMTGRLNTRRGAISQIKGTCKFAEMFYALWSIPHVILFTT